MDLNHKSNTAFPGDDYNINIKTWMFGPEGWHKLIKGHPCYDPVKVSVLGARLPATA